MGPGAKDKAMGTHCAWSLKGAGAPGMWGEQSLRKPAGKLGGHWKGSKAQGFPPTHPRNPPDPKLSSRTELGAASITVTTKKKNKPKPISGVLFRLLKICQCKVR